MTDQSSGSAMDRSGTVPVPRPVALVPAAALGVGCLAVPALAALGAAGVLPTGPVVAIGLLPLLISWGVAIVRWQAWDRRSVWTGLLGLIGVALPLAVGMTGRPASVVAALGHLLILLCLLEVTVRGLQRHPEQARGARLWIEYGIVALAAAACLVGIVPGILADDPGGRWFDVLAAVLAAGATAMAVLLLACWTWSPGWALWALGMLTVAASRVVSGAESVHAIGVLAGGLLVAASSVHPDLGRALAGLARWRPDRAWQRSLWLCSALAVGTVGIALHHGASGWSEVAGPVLAAVAVLLLGVRARLLVAGMSAPRGDLVRAPLDSVGAAAWLSSIQPMDEGTVEVGAVAVVTMLDVRAPEEPEAELDRQVLDRLSGAITLESGGAGGPDRWALARHGEVLHLILARRGHRSDAGAGDHPDSADSADTAARLARLAGTVDGLLAAPFRIDGVPVRVDHAVGWAHRTATATRRPNGVVGDATWAARTAAPGRPAVFDPVHRTAIRRRAEIGALLDRSLTALSTGTPAHVAESGFSIVFEPVVSLRDGETVAAETLARWRAPGIGPVSPGEFIPIAEQNRNITALGDWVLGEACLRAARSSAVRAVAVNLSGDELVRPDLYGRVMRALHNAGLDPRRLILEVTETVVDAAVDAGAGALKSLAAKGVSLYLDDFGAASSGLARLVALPWSVIKLDRWFLSGLTRDSQRAALVGSIAQLARRLGVDTLAEGVEDVRTLELVRDLGCDLVQGWVFGQARATLAQAWQQHVPRDFQLAARVPAPGKA
ncbi:EAL domain-containing protein [Nakamurella alba]|nr:EAL domain-containing protein [Nakamurella alba]